jgi:hypothetical protein
MRMTNLALSIEAMRNERTQFSRMVDLDIDIGADAIDYKCVPGLSVRSLHVTDLFSFSAIANQDGLSALEVEMRKLEGVVKEIRDEMTYLKEREERFTGTNRLPLFCSYCRSQTTDFRCCRIHQRTSAEVRGLHLVCIGRPRCLADFPSTSILPEKVFN